MRGLGRPPAPAPARVAGLARIGVPARASGAARGAAARSIWLISFTDLMCLMLAFFVLAFSMSEPKQDSWQAMAQSMAARRIDGRSGAVFNVAMLDPKAPINLDYLGTLLMVQFAGNADLEGVVPTRQDDRVVIGLPDDLLFEPDQATFSERGRLALFVLGGVLGRISNRVEVTGHAGWEPPVAGERDGWELSLSRAVAVATALHRSGYQRHLAVRSVAARPLPAAEAGRVHLIDVVVRDLEEGT